MQKPSTESCNSHKDFDNIVIFKNISKTQVCEAKSLFHIRNIILTSK